MVLWVDAADVVVASGDFRSDAFTHRCSLAGVVVRRIARGLHGAALPVGLSEQILLRRKLGVLSQSDAHQLKQIWKSQIQPRF